MRAISVIRQEVRRKFGQPLEKSGSLWLRCPLPSHGGFDSTPSCKINLDVAAPAPVGFVYCFGCGGKLPWNAFAEQFGLQRLTELDSEVTDSESVTYKVSKSVDNMTETATDLENAIKKEYGVNLVHSIGKDWRTISAKLLNRLGAKKIVDKQSETSLILPVSVYGEMVGMVKARMIKVKGQPSYYNSTGSWASTVGLFPFDYTVKCLEKWKTNKLVLGEGPRDALNPLQYRIPTLAILGAKNFTKVKAQLLESLDLDEIILAFDPDAAGKRATELVGNILVDTLDVSVIDVAEYGDVDLGEAPDALLDELQLAVYGKVLT